MPVEHVCDKTFKEALTKLLQWVPERCWSSKQMEDAFKRESKDQGDTYDFQEQPFFGSQAWTYLIWNKEDARSFHAYFHNLVRAAGIDPYELMKELQQKERK